MSIVTHTITTIPQPSGTISYTLLMFDQDGRSYESVGELPAGTDVAAFVAARIVERNEQLAADEFNAIVDNG